MRDRGRNRYPPGRDRRSPPSASTRAAVRLWRPDHARLAFLPKLRAGLRTGGRSRSRRHGRSSKRRGPLVADSDEREAALAATEERCPRCAAPREPGQEYCLECGLHLPTLAGPVPALRRHWIRRIGWYPGDWIWISALTLLVAAAGAAISIGVTTDRGSAGG